MSGKARGSRKVKLFDGPKGWTMMSNILLDRVMPSLSGSEWKVLCFIIRKTLGWQKTSEQLSYTQIAAGTGIKHPKTISSALKTLTGRHYVIAPPGGAWETGTYTLNTGLEVDAEEESAASENEASTASKSEAAPTSLIEAEGVTVASLFEDAKRKPKKTPERKQTHGPRALSPAAAAPTAAVAAGVGAGSGKSIYTAEERQAHMRENGLGWGWFTDSRDGRYDESITAQRAARAPEVVERARAAPVLSHLGYGAAVQLVSSVVTRGGPGTDPASEIERLFEAGRIDEDSRARLLARDWGAVASGGQGRAA